MIVNPFTGVLNSSLSGAKGNALDRVQKAIAQLASGERITKASDDTASLSLAVQLQNRTAGLRTAVGNITQASSLSTVASEAITQIQERFSHAREVAIQANSGVVDNATRKALNAEFRATLNEASRIAESTNFNGTPLLDGSLKISLGGLLGETSTEDATALEIPSLDEASLLGKQDLNVLTQENAGASIDALQQAINTLGAVQASVGSFQETLDVASAGMESALFNQDAALSLLSDTDIDDAATLLSQALLQQDFAIAVQAQAKRLPPSMLELITN